MSFLNLLRLVIFAENINNARRLKFNNIYSSWRNNSPFFNWIYLSNL